MHFLLRRVLDLGRVSRSRALFATQNKSQQFRRAKRGEKYLEVRVNLKIHFLSRYWSVMTAECRKFPLSALRISVRWENNFLNLTLRIDGCILRVTKFRFGDGIEFAGIEVTTWPITDRSLTRVLPHKYIFPPPFSDDVFIFMHL